MEYSWNGRQIRLAFLILLDMFYLLEDIHTLISSDYSHCIFSCCNEFSELYHPAVFFPFFFHPNVAATRLYLRMRAFFIYIQSDVNISEPETLVPCCIIMPLTHII